MIFPVKEFEDLPEELNNSSYVDFLLFLAKLKPSLRIKLNDECIQDKLKMWCINNHFKFVTNEDNYFYIARDKYSVDQLKRIDDSYDPHEFEFGRLLGYPICCCQKIAVVGEVYIDEWEAIFVKESHFEGRYEIINPKGYSEGYSLISHIPCSPKCMPSLKIAQKVLSIIMRYKYNKYFDKWNYWTNLKPID